MSGKFLIPNRLWAILTLVCLTVQNLHQTSGQQEAVALRELEAALGEAELGSPES